MAVYRLDDTVIDSDFKLIAVHTSLEGSRLAYFLNEKLNTRFYKNVSCLTCEALKGEFSHFKWEDESTKMIWHCVANKAICEENLSQESLFNTISSTYYLIDEMRRVDFFIKIEDIDHNFNENKIVQKIAGIPWVTSVYAVEVKKLKAKHKLIF